MVYFSPEDHLEKELIQLINEETKSIHVCIYTLTHRGVIGALIEAKKRGVHIEVIVDRFSIRANSPLHRLVEAMIPIHVWNPGSPRQKRGRRSIMHNKYCVFGDQKVWTGSFNMTYEAARMHQENALVIHDPAVAHAYKNQFYTIKLRSCSPLPAFLASNPHKRPKKLSR